MAAAEEAGEEVVARVSCRSSGNFSLGAVEEAGEEMVARSARIVLQRKVVGRPPLRWGGSNVTPRHRMMPDLEICFLGESRSRLRPGGIPISSRVVDFSG